MKNWTEAMRSLPDHKRRMMENQQRTANIKRKRTSGYNVFCSEYRRKCQAETPHLQFSEISKKVRIILSKKNLQFSCVSPNEIFLLLKYFY